MQEKTTNSLAHLDEKYFGPRIDLGSYAVHEFLPGIATGEKWSIALIEIDDSPRHFHKIEKELFVVVEGVLDIEVDRVRHILHTGQSIEILPGKIHKLQSAGVVAVRVLCISFPAFNPSDMYIAE